MKLAVPFSASATVLPIGTSILPLAAVPSAKAISTGTAFCSGMLSALLRSNIGCISPLCRFGTRLRLGRPAEQEACWETGGPEGRAIAASGQVFRPCHGSAIYVLGG